jgi:4-hydroxybenzoate polyprenyltransferase
MRPQQWTKNAFVFVGLLFGHAWSDPVMVRDVVVMAVAFSLISSAVYVFNDITDRERDRVHPRKRKRPLAAGSVSVGTANGLTAFLLAFSLALAAWVSTAGFLILIGYAAMNLAYSVKLKNVPILDVFIIAAGFLLRVLAGTAGVGIPPSNWLLLCALMLTLFLGFAKRRAEMMENEINKTEDPRQVLQAYNSTLLDKMIAITAACVLMSYALYTVNPDTMRIHGTENLGYTLPFVIYGVFRYMFLLHRADKGTDPSVDLITDPHILGALAGWVILVAWLIA